MQNKSNHGGKRTGAGRKSKFNEKTKLIRLPISFVEEIEKRLSSQNNQSEILDIRLFEATTSIEIPLATERVQAGFPSPAQDYVDQKLDLNEYLIQNPNATFIVRVNSQSMLGVGIDIGDALIVDRSLEPQHRDIVLAYIDDHFTVKRLMLDSSGFWLKAENEEFSNIYPKEGQQFELWGVVTNVIKKFR